MFMTFLMLYNYLEPEEIVTKQVLPEKEEDEEEHIDGMWQLPNSQY